MNELSLPGSRQQGPNKSLDWFMTVLYTLAEHSNYGNLKMALIRDHFVVGLTDVHLFESMQLDSNLTLKGSVIMARQTETLRQQQNNLRGENLTEAYLVDKVERKKYM